MTDDRCKTFCIPCMTDESHTPEPSTPTPSPVPAEQAERSERYAVAIHDAVETDFSLADEEPPVQAHFAVAAEAAIAVADAEQDAKLSGLTAQAIHIMAAVETLSEENTRLHAEVERLRAAAPSAPADPGLRDRIRRAICEAEGFAWDTDMLEPDEYGEVADAVLTVLPAPADRATVLTDTERTMLTYALDEAQEHIWYRDGFTDEDQAAVTSLRRLADEAQNGGAK